MWPFIYPWPQRPGGLVEEGFKELAKRWKPILDCADEHGVDVAYELHPGEDLEAATRMLNAFIEERVREMPEQYLWTHRRFKTRPPGEPSPYDRR